MNIFLSTHHHHSAFVFFQLFEGMKAYRGEDGRLRLFRPDRNMARMLSTAKRSSLPSFDSNQMIECIKKLIQVDREWIPHSTTSSLYIRPTFIGTDVSLLYNVNSFKCFKFFTCARPLILSLYLAFFRSRKPKSSFAIRYLMSSGSLFRFRIQTSVVDG